MPEPFSYTDLDALIASLDPANSRCREQISAARQLMDVSCDSRTITLHEWRVLLEDISVVQSRCGAADRADIWKPAHR